MSEWEVQSTVLRNDEVVMTSDGFGPTVDFALDSANNDLKLWTESHEAETE